MMVKKKEPESKMQRKTVSLLDFISLTNEERQYLAGEYEQFRNSVKTAIIKGMEGPEALLETAKEMLKRKKRI